MIQNINVGNGKWIIGDCFDAMANIPNSSVDMILCDLPYGTTQNKWDSVLPLDRLWAEYWRIAKPNAAIVLTAAQPFTSVLICSALAQFRYEWVWRKSRPTGQLNAKREPLRDKEDIAVFYRKRPIYNPQMTTGKPNHVSGKPRMKSASANWGQQYEITEHKTDQKYPRAVLDFSSLNPVGQLHPTQKPTDLFEYFIRTYTDEGMTVVDNTAGSGTTAIAAERSGRRWICIERDEEYSAKAIARIEGEIQSRLI
jgi:site-specific DNA-methyltransferase (adenine-specific)